jgi:multidrug efflux pump subunit AcrA (membrane-fusion protein)
VNTMRLLKIMLVMMVLGMLSVPLLSCGSEPVEAELPETQTVAVQRGDLIIEITAAGNLALSHTEDLAVDLFYGQSGITGTKGTIGEVLVEEGDTIEEGQVLVTVDKDEWEDHLSALEKALTTDQRNLTAKQSALTKAERQVISDERTVIDKEGDVAEAERNVTTKEFAVRQAQLNVETAEYNLGQVKEAIDDVEDAEFNIKIAQMGKTGELAGLSNDYAYWTQLLNNAYQDKEDAEDELAEVLAGTSTSITSSDYAEAIILEIEKKQLLVEQEQMDLEDAELDVADAEKAVDDAKYDLEEAKLDVEDARQDVEDARLDVEDARQDVEDTQEDLEEAQSKSPEITAPFVGFVTKVNVEGGDEVLDGTIAVQVADPEKFEAEILVSEMDIMQVKLEGEAWVEVDAIQGLSLPATVTHISPTATIQSGVVNYEVTVEIQSLEAVVRERKEAMQQAMADIAAGELPAPLLQAIEEGRITREQAEEMIKQGPPAGMEPPPGMEIPPGMEGTAGQEAPVTGQLSLGVPEDFQLREGLTVTVTIIVEEKTNVLLVPNAAITSERGQSYVQVVTASGESEQRAIQTGISDYQFTEVTEGLSEGEQILVPQGTTTTPTTEERPRGGMMMFGGPPPR